MIYNQNLNIIFFKTKKVGGTSFEIALSRFCNTSDIVTPISSVDEKIRKKLGYQAPVNYLEKDRDSALLAKSVKGDFKNHMNSEKIYQSLGSEIFNNATKIAIHREPLDFLISQFFFKMKGKAHQEKVPFKIWLEENYENVLQNYKIAPLSGPFKPDIVIPYEDLSEEIKKTKQLPESFFDTFNHIKAKSQHRPKNTRNAKRYFIECGCEEWVTKIAKLLNS